MDEKGTYNPKGHGNNRPLSEPAYSLSYDVAITELGSRIKESLSNNEVASRPQHYGANKLEESEGILITKILIQ